MIKQQDNSKYTHKKDYKCPSHQKHPILQPMCIVEIYDDSQSLLGIVLIKRKYPPLGLTLPGGFIEIGEKIEDACIREMKEEISLDVTIESLLGVYSNLKRDKRFHTVPVVYICKTCGMPIATDDAKEAMVIPLEKLELDQLVFNHGDILRDYLQKRNEVL